MIVTAPRRSFTWRQLWLCITVLLGGLWALAFGISVLGYQGLLWSREGSWSSLKLRVAWDWLGFQSTAAFAKPFAAIFGWLLQTPLWVDMTVVGVVLMVLGKRCFDAITAGIARHWR